VSWKNTEPKALKQEFKYNMDSSITSTQSRWTKKAFAASVSTVSSYKLKDFIFPEETSLSNRFKGFEIMSYSGGDEFPHKVIFDSCYLDEQETTIEGSPEADSSSKK
jgi:hypothetical protein